MNKILYHTKPGTTEFFLMKDVPEMAGSTQTGVFDPNYSKKIYRYNRDMQACKEEAIKNGEITNTELLPIHYVSNSKFEKQYYHGNWSSDKKLKIKPGDTFDLPKGLKVVTEEILSDGWVPSYNNPDNNNFEESAEPKTVIRLVTDVEGLSAKEETQEALWTEVLDFCETHYINDIRVLEHFVRSFTIQRKSK